MVTRVLQLVGSPTSEFYADLSRLYAQDCLRSTQDPDRYDTYLAYVSPDASWRFPTGLDAAALDAAAPMPVDEAIRRIVELRIDVMVPQMFCVAGMTHYRALFDVLEIPYVGNASDVMAIGLDKARAKALVAAAGVAVPDGEVLTAGATPRIAPPAVVKPVDADNSFGVTLVRDLTDYASAITQALAHGSRALVESYIELGREVRCGILERDGELLCLPLEEYAVNSATHPIRGYDDKVSQGQDGELGLVAKEASKAWILDPADPLTEVVWEAARQCHVALGCRHYSLFDFRVDPQGRPWFLEAGLYCSFAGQSVIAMMAKAAGIDLAELFATAVGQCLPR